MEIFLNTTEFANTLAQTCLEQGGNPRPECRWLSKQFNRLQKKHNLNRKSDTDAFVYEKIYGHAPKSTTEYLKIRYWRTGHFTPSNRDLCLRFADALELSENERNYLIGAWYDHSLCRYNIPMVTDESYCKKQVFLQSLIQHYLKDAPSAISIPSSTPPQTFLRHRYFIDALLYTHSRSGLEHNPEIYKNHIISIRYDSELKRHLALLGEIPRKTMLRHLIILNQPEFSLESINKQLILLDYLPLSEEHTLVGGERLDMLLIRLLCAYEALPESLTLSERMLWFRNVCRYLDWMFAKVGCENLRFMHFKALDYTIK